MFSPASAHAPCLQKAGDAQASICFGTVGNFQLQGALSPINHVLIFGNWMNNTLANKGDTSATHCMYTEYGLGFYTMPDLAENQKLQFGLLLGKGSGYSFDKFNASGYNYYTLYELHQQVNGTFNRYFLQPAFSIVRPHASTSFFIKVSRLDMRTQSNNYVASSPLNGVQFTQSQLIEMGIENAWHTRDFSVLFQYKMMFPDANYYHFVTGNGTVLTQSTLSFMLGISFTTENIKNWIHPHQVGQSLFKQALY
jgi:hypothetical protein